MGTETSPCRACRLKLVDKEEFPCNCCHRIEKYRAEFGVIIEMPMENILKLEAKQLKSKMYSKLYCSYCGKEKDTDCNKYCNNNCRRRSLNNVPLDLEILDSDRYCVDCETVYSLEEMHKETFRCKKCHNNYKENLTTLKQKERTK